MLRTMSWAAVLFALGLFTVAPAEGQSTPAGNEFQVNVTTNGGQITPDVASDAQGNYIVVWHPSSARQVFNDGSLGPEFAVNTSFNAFGVARAPGGQFVVASEFSSGYVVRAQAFDAMGSPQGSEINVSEGNGDDIVTLDVDMVNDDEFLVVWSRGVAGLRDILGRQLNVDGTPDGDVFEINNLTAGTQDEPAVALNTTGEFAVVWVSTTTPGNDTDITSIQGRVFASDGQPLGDQFQVNVNTTARQDRPDIAALADGSWVATWSDGSGAADSQARGIAAQRFDADGQLLGTPLAVNTFTNGDQILPSVAPLSDGGFMVTWESQGSSGGDNLLFSVQGRVYDSLGQPLGEQFQVNSYAPQTQSRVAVATGPDLRSLVVWESNGSAGDDTDEESIQGQLFGPLVPEIFTDGFETGDTASWADAQP